MKKSMLATALVAIVAVPAIADAKKKPEVTSLELQQLQSREFEVPKDVAFAAVMTVLQDSGYRIGSADRDTGLITGAASTNTKTTWVPFIGFGKSKKTPVVSAYIEERGPLIARVRLNFVMTKNKGNQFGSSADEEPIMDTIVYQDAFERINKEVFVRQALRTAPAAPAAVAPMVVAPVAAPSTNAPVASTPATTAPISTPLK